MNSTISHEWPDQRDLLMLLVEYYLDIIGVMSGLPFVLQPLWTQVTFGRTKTPLLAFDNNPEIPAHQMTLIRSTSFGVVVFHTKNKGYWLQFLRIKASYRVLEPDQRCQYYNDAPFVYPYNLNIFGKSTDCEEFMIAWTIRTFNSPVGVQQWGWREAVWDGLADKRQRKARWMYKCMKFIHPS